MLTQVAALQYPNLHCGFHSTLPRIQAEELISIGQFRCPSYTFGWWQLTSSVVFPANSIL